MFEQEVKYSRAALMKQTRARLAGTADSRPLPPTLAQPQPSAYFYGNYEIGEGEGA